MDIWKRLPFILQEIQFLLIFNFQDIQPNISIINYHYQKIKNKYNKIIIKSSSIKIFGKKSGSFSFLNSDYFIISCCEYVGIQTRLKSKLK